MLDLSKRNMQLPISMNLCCLDFNYDVSQNYSAELYSSKRNRLLPISLNLCCLDSDHEVYNLICCFDTIAERIVEWTPVCLHYSLYSWRKSEQVFSRDIFRLRDSSKSFSIHITPFFLVVSTSSLVRRRHISSL